VDLLKSDYGMDKHADVSNNSEDVLEWTGNWSASSLGTLWVYCNMFSLLNGNIGDCLCRSCSHLVLCGYICVLESYLYFVFKKNNSEVLIANYSP